MYYIHPLIESHNFPCENNLYLPNDKLEIIIPCKACYIPLDFDVWSYANMTLAFQHSKWMQHQHETDTCYAKLIRCCYSSILQEVMANVKVCSDRITDGFWQFNCYMPPYWGHKNIFGNMLIWQNFKMTFQYLFECNLSIVRTDKSGVKIARFISYIFS